MAQGGSVEMIVPKRALRIAVEGCGHGTLDAIYASVNTSCKIKGWDGVDLLIIGGDFQAVRTQKDLNVTAMPPKYRQMGDFHQYYYGTKIAPYLTVFVGGNHEASNHLFELYYGGWVAPNIYYLGAANVVRLGSLKIAGLSGIWKGNDYRKPHFERLPYNEGTMRSIYHVRELDIRKLLAYRSQVDVGISHDWPQGIEWYGDHQSLFKYKPYFLPDAQSGQLGSVAAKKVMDRLRPPHWFSAHMHWKYTAFKDYGSDVKEDSRVETNLFTKEPEPVASAGPKNPNKVPLGVRKQAYPTRSGNEAAVSAWNSFHIDGSVREAVEDAKFIQEAEKRSEIATRNGQTIAANYNFEEIYKQVQVDGTSREYVETQGADSHLDEDTDSFPIPQVDGCPFSVPRKRQRDQSPLEEAAEPLMGNGHLETTIPQHDGAESSVRHITNPDAIDIDMSDDDDEIQTARIPDKISGPVHLSHSKSTTLETVGANVEQVPSTSQNISVAEACSTEASVHDLPHSGPVIFDTAGGGGTASLNEVPDNVAPNTDTEKSANKDEVSEEMRSKLAALSSTFAEQGRIEVSPALPHPSTITNTQTRFLALSKCEPNKEFLQLLEIEPLSTADDGFQHPLKLSYDPEWLAILRVFASELSLGGTSREHIPQHKGDTYYRDRILEEEIWVKEHVIDKDLLEIPENFEITASHDSDPGNESDMPREVTNPQTAQFCRLIGIENLFDISEEERDLRMASAPVQGSEQLRDRSYSGRGGGRGRGGHRGGGRGRGRGRSRGRW